MITKDISIMELIVNYPQSREILHRYGMGCCNCFGAASETIEKGAKVHNVNLQTLLAELNGWGSESRVTSDE